MPIRIGAAEVIHQPVVLLGGAMDLYRDGVASLARGTAFSGRSTARTYAHGPRARRQSWRIARCVEH